MVAGKNNEIRDLQQLTKTMHAITKRVAGIAGCKEEARKAGKTYFVGEDKRWNAGGDFFIINYSDFSDLMNEADFLRYFPLLEKELEANEHIESAIVCDRMECMKITGHAKPSRIRMTGTNDVNMLEILVQPTGYIPAPVEARGTMRIPMDKADRVPYCDITEDLDINDRTQRLNFVVDCLFDVDAVFGTHVVTDENDDYLNVYVEWDCNRNEVADDLLITLVSGMNEPDKDLYYPLNDEEKAMLKEKMERCVMKHTGMSLKEYSMFHSDAVKQELGEDVMGCLLEGSVPTKELTGFLKNPRIFHGYRKNHEYRGMAFNPATGNHVEVTTELSPALAKTTTREQVVRSKMAGDGSVYADLSPVDIDVQSRVQMTVTLQSPWVDFM